MKKVAILGLISSAVMVACGGGNEPRSQSLLSGRFVDAPVVGLRYEGSSGVSGTTGANGDFRYAPGTTVSFSIGGVQLPSVAAASLVTPMDLVNSSSPYHPGAVAIGRLLQSLDNDANPDNGITIALNKLSSSARAPASWGESTDTQLAALLASSVPLRTESQARQHLAAQVAQAQGLPTMSVVGRYSSGGTTASHNLVAEIVAFHGASKSLFVTSDTSTKPSSFKRIDLSGLGTSALTDSTRSTNLTVANTVNVAADVNDSTFQAGGVQSLDIHQNLLAIAVQAKVKTDPGVVAFYQLNASGVATFVKKVLVGALPDGLAFSPDGKHLVVANEAELSNTFATDGIDPPGSISLIGVIDGVPADSATSLGFTDFNSGGSRAPELPAGVRIGRSGATVAQDLEPEYVSISPDSSTAYVTLQENNAVAVVDLQSKKIARIFALGSKDHAKYALAASDRYASTVRTEYENPSTAPILKTYAGLRGLYMPDGVASFSVNGRSYFVTANEGDDRDDFLGAANAETARFKDVVASLDASAFPTALTDAMKSDQGLGRLTLLTKDAKGKLGDRDADGDLDEIYTLGARSFSIWDATTGAQVFDSGEDFERIAYANAADDATNKLALLKAPQMLGRLDNKGPEPESVVVGQIGSDLYAFIGLERSSGIMMYQITNPARPKWVQYIRNTNDLTDGDISPEGLKFIPASASPTGQALLVVGHEVTGSVVLYQVR